jgi:hypothetical protein
MMTRARMIQRCKHLNLLYSAAHQQIFTSPAVTASRRRGNNLGTTIKYLLRTTSSVAGIGLGNTINEHSPAMHIERRRGQRPGYSDQVPATHNERRRG